MTSGDKLGLTANDFNIFRLMSYFNHQRDEVFLLCFMYARMTQTN